MDLPERKKYIRFFVWTVEGQVGIRGSDGDWREDKVEGVNSGRDS